MNWYPTFDFLRMYHPYTSYMFTRRGPRYFDEVAYSLPPFSSYPYTPWPTYNSMFFDEDYSTSTQGDSRYASDAGPSETEGRASRMETVKKAVSSTWNHLKGFMPKERSSHEKKSSESLLMERLKLYGLKVKSKISGDGNCQFASVADQLYGKPSLHSEIRFKAVQWLRENPTYRLPNESLIKDYLQSEFFPSWSDYCDYMSEPGVWGDHLTLVAISESFHLKIVVVSSMEVEPGIDPFTVIVPKTWNEHRDKTIYLAHLHEVHYSSICEDDSLYI